MTVDSHECSDTSLNDSSSQAIDRSKMLAPAVNFLYLNVSNKFSRAIVMELANGVFPLSHIQVPTGT